jgi:hypothetical protein
MGWVRCAEMLVVRYDGTLTTSSRYNLEIKGSSHEISLSVYTAVCCNVISSQPLDVEYPTSSGPKDPFMVPKNWTTQKSAKVMRHEITAKTPIPRSPS